MLNVKLLLILLDLFKAHCNLVINTFETVLKMYFNFFLLYKYTVNVISLYLF